MLMGLGLLALGFALLCYVATARSPAPGTSGEASSSAPRAAPTKKARTSGRGATALSTGAEAGRAGSPGILAPSPLRDAVLAAPKAAELAPPPVELPSDNQEPTVVVSFEEDAEEEEATSPFARILVTASGDTDRGQRRRANDDSLLVMPEHCLFAVADGMGGYAGGSVASRTAVDTVAGAFRQNAFVAELRSKSPLPRRGGELASAILQAHQAVFSLAQATPEFCKMGTTLVAARFSPNKQRVYIGNVGDSRCYRFRGGRLRQLTTDQTMGTIGLQGPRASDLLQAVGVTPDLSVELIIDKPRSGDVYLLCSDGLNKMVSDQQIESVLAGDHDLESSVYGLIESANDGGGRDNITVVLVKVLDRSLGDLVGNESLKPKIHGWSKLPDVAADDPCGFDDVTVIGGVPEEELTMLRVGLAPPKPRA